MMMYYYQHPKFQHDKLVDEFPKFLMKSRPVNYMYYLRDRQNKDQTPSQNSVSNPEQPSTGQEVIYPMSSSEQLENQSINTESDNTSETEELHIEIIEETTDSAITEATASNTGISESSTQNTSQIHTESDTENIADNTAYLSESVNNIQNKMATGINLKKFSGSENVHVWLSNLDSWQKFHKVTDNEALLAIGCSLEGQAETWLQTLTTQQRTNLKDFKDCLKSRFAPQETNFSLLSIKQQHGESTDTYLSRAEKTALGHDLPEIYKVQFVIQGLEKQIKEKVLSKEPKTFQQLRHAVSLANAQIECRTENDNSLNLIALAAQLKESLKEEINALVPNIPQTQKKSGWKNKKQTFGQFQANPQFQPPVNFVPSVPNNAWTNPTYAVPPQNFQQQPPMQQMQTAPMRQNGQGMGGGCKGCGKSCYPRFNCPAYNVQCFNCGKMRHFASVCQSPKTRPHFSGTTHPQNPTNNQTC
ncbi:uncharacterized protein LOC134242911 [Saccostrea cucullata]|uniref:uncharacterized protein LOC134242911 n=1 Tax=Saccostrea cuccullata TaxID=36930 RepID=UPI002ED320FC